MLDLIRSPPKKDFYDMELWNIDLLCHVHPLPLPHHLGFFKAVYSLHQVKPRAGSLLEMCWATQRMSLPFLQQCLHQQHGSSGIPKILISLGHVLSRPHLSSAVKWHQLRYGGNKALTCDRSVAGA